MSVCVVAYPTFSEPDVKLIASIRKRYDRQFKIIKPHFTLLFPVDSGDSEKLCAHTEAVVANGSFAPFAVSFSSVSVVSGAHEKRYYLFLIPDAGGDSIKQLHDALNTGIMQNELRSDIPYIPHITIGIFDNEDEADRMAGRLNGYNIAISCLVKALDIVRDRVGETKGVESIRKILL